MANEYKYEVPLTYDTREKIEFHLKEAAAAYDAFRPKAHKTRELYLYKIAEELAGEDRKEISHHFKQLINRERIRSHYKRIKSCEGRTRGGGVDKVLVEKKDSNYFSKRMKLNKLSVQQTRRNFSKQWTPPSGLNHCNHLSVNRWNLQNGKRS